MHLRERSTAAAGLAVAVAGAYLFLRLARDVLVKPLYEDEALAGLVSARPFFEMLDVVLWDRGGAPLHFVLSHLTLAVEPSPQALRAVSVLFALAAIPLCYDLGRRLEGRVAGATAALLAAASTMLGVYGSFGRMYALLAFAGALAADLFVRALDLRTGRAALAAAAAAWLLPAVHPYGLIPLGVQAAVALAVWRGRPLRPALPVLAVGLALVPFLVADLRLADRFGVGLEGRGLLPPDRAFAYFVRMLRAFAGGDGRIAFPVLLGFALAGLVVLARRRPAVAAYAAIALAAPPVLLMLGRTGSAIVGEHLSVRHLIFLLPLWSALAGVGLARAAAALAGPAQAAAVAAVAALALIAPEGGLEDPRYLSSGKRFALDAPADFLRGAVAADDVLFPYSPVYLAALPATREADVLTRARAELVRRELERLELPVSKVYVAVPLDGARLDEDALERPNLAVHRFRYWLLLEAAGPFADESETVTAALEAVEAADAAITSEPLRLRGYFRQSRAALSGSL
jgi:Dolichyl-phosphate-mannose-protein mannosyltransferase